MYACAAAIILAKDKLKTLNYLIHFSTALILMYLLKMIFNAPRPYMVNPDIEAIASDTGLGHPSGHA